MSNLKEQRIKKYQAILKEHGEDVLAVTKPGFFDEKSLDTYYRDPNGQGNVESNFCMCLTAVMLLKKMGIFDRNCRIRKIKNIGGGYYFDGDNFGLVFEYDFQNYALISKKSDDDMIYIPLDEGTEDVINQINEACDNRYLIDFSSSRTSSVSKKR